MCSKRSRQRGLARVYIHFLMRNRPMMRLAAHFTCEILIDQDEAQATIRLPAAGASLSLHPCSPARWRTPEKKHPLAGSVASG